MRESVSERARIISHGITLSAAFSQLHLHHLYLHQDYHPYHHSFLFFANLSLSFLPSRNGEKFVKFSFKDCGQKNLQFFNLMQPKECRTIVRNRRARTATPPAAPQCPRSADRTGWCLCGNCCCCWWWSCCCWWAWQLLVHAPAWHSILH